MAGVVANKLKVLIPPHFSVSAEVVEIWEVAEALEPASTKGQQARLSDPVVIAAIAIDGLPSKEPSANARRVGVSELYGVSRHWAEFPKHRGFLDEPYAQRKLRAVSEQIHSQRLLLVLLGLSGESRAFKFFVEMDQAAREFETAETIERIKRERAATAHRLHRQRLVSAEKG